MLICLTRLQAAPWRCCGPRCRGLHGLHGVAIAGGHPIGGEGLARAIHRQPPHQPLLAQAQHLSAGLIPFLLHAGHAAQVGLVQLALAVGHLTFERLALALGVLQAVADLRVLQRLLQGLEVLDDVLAHGSTHRGCGWCEHPVRAVPTPALATGAEGAARVGASAAVMTNTTRAGHGGLWRLSVLALWHSLSTLK